MFGNEVGQLKVESVFLQAAVNRNTSGTEGLSENDSGVELTNENSPLTAAEPPSPPFSPKHNQDAASSQGTHCVSVTLLCILRPLCTFSVLF